MSTKISLRTLAAALIVAAGFIALVVASSAARAQQVVERLPNMTPLPAFEVSAGLNLIYRNP